MWKDESIRKGVIASVLASLIVIIFITPFLNIIWGLMVDGGVIIQDYYVNAIYKHASLGNRNWLDVVFYLYLLSIFVGMIVTLVYKIIQKRKELYTKILAIEKKLNEMENIKTEDAVVLSKDQIKSKVQVLKSGFKKENWNVAFIYMMIAILFIISILSYFGAYADLQLNSTFQQRIRIVAPFIEEQREEELNALWAQMRTRSDYENILRQFENIAIKEKIELPKPLMK